MNLPNDISSLQALILKLMARVEELEKENAELKSRLAQNSNNSNCPPSSDGFKKRPAFPRKKGKKTGGQKGHKGRTLEMVSHPDHVIKYVPVKCQCGQSLKGVMKYTVERRQIFDLPEPKLEVTEH